MPAVATACAAILVAVAAGGVSERPSTSPGFGDAVIVAALLYSGVVSIWLARRRERLRLDDAALYWVGLAFALAPVSPSVGGLLPGRVALLTVVVATVAAVLACCGWAWYAAHRLDIGDRMFPGSS